MLLGWHCHKAAQEDGALRRLTIGQWQAQVQAALQNGAVQLLHGRRRAIIPAWPRLEQLQTRSLALQNYAPV